jgi:arachidonate 15-lipoxygenase
VDADWLASLPPLDVAVQQFCIMTFLGSTRHGTLGDYGDELRATKAQPALQRFKKALSTIDAEIVQRNQRRPRAYEYLRPSLIPNSTNI